MLEKQQQQLSKTHRMQWVCKAAGSEFIKAHAAAVGTVCLQARIVDDLAAEALSAAGLKIPYAAVLAAAPAAASDAVCISGLAIMQLCGSGMDLCRMLHLLHTRFEARIWRMLIT
jgi:hypothetical protein